MMDCKTCLYYSRDYHSCIHNDMQQSVWTEELADEEFVDFKIPVEDFGCTLYEKGESWQK